MTDKIVEVITTAIAKRNKCALEFSESCILRNDCSCKKDATAALSALESAGYVVVPKQREYICKSCGLRQQEGHTPDMSF